MKPTFYIRVTFAVVLLTIGFTSKSYAACAANIAAGNWFMAASSSSRPVLYVQPLTKYYGSTKMGGYNGSQFYAQSGSTKPSLDSTDSVFKCSSISKLTSNKPASCTYYDAGSSLANSITLYFNFIQNTTTCEISGTITDGSKTLVTLRSGFINAYGGSVIAQAGKDNDIVLLNFMKK